MPVRSLHSSVKKWPSRAEALDAFRSWARKEMARRPDICRIGCFGSLAKGGWGVGSDLDIIIVLAESKVPPLRRASEWDTTSLPVAADLVVLTDKECRGGYSARFKRVLEQETIWEKR